MALADELLDSISEEQFAEYMLVEENPHIVIDEDRNIILPERYKIIAAQGDHDMTTYTFDCPRFSDGRDMSKMVVYINYIRSDGETGSYPADNVSIDAQNNDLMHFEWKPLLPATIEHGAFAFLVCVCRTEPDGSVKNHWSTRLCKDATISEGMDCHKDTIINMYPDVITRILERLNVLEDGGTTSVQYTVQDLEEEQKVQARKNIEAADAKEVSKLSEEIGSSFVEWKVSSNLLNVSAMVQGGVNKNNGELVFNTTYYTISELIEVIVGKTLYFSRCYASGYKENLIIPCVWLYDENKSYLSMELNKENFTIPENCKFIRLGVVTTTFNDQITTGQKHCLSYSSNAEDYEPFYPPHYESDIVDIRLRGASKNEDCREIMRSIIKDKKTVLIPNGVWRTRGLKITKPFSIIGLNANYVSHTFSKDENENLINSNFDNVSALAPYEDNQNYLLYIALEVDYDNKIIPTGFTLKNLVITDINYDGEFNILNRFNITTNIIIEHSSHGYVDLIFNHCTGCGLRMSASFEVMFERLWFREFSGVSTPLLFKNTNGKNITQCIFNSIQFENCYGTLIEWETGCDFAHSKIKSILIEGCANTNVMVDVDESGVDIPMFKLGHVTNLVIDSIQFNNFNHKSYVIDGVVYTRRTIFSREDGTRCAFIYVGSIILDFGTKTNVYLVNSKETKENKVLLIFGEVLSMSSIEPQVINENDIANIIIRNKCNANLNCN